MGFLDLLLRGKTTMVSDENALATLFGADGIQEKTAEALPYADQHTEAVQLRDKLAGAADHAQAQISGLEIMYADLADRVYQGVKQASLSGLSLSNVVKAWETVAPKPDYIKVAFELMTPRFLREGVFHRVEDMVASVDKTASVGMVNPEHPLVVDFERPEGTSEALPVFRLAR